MKAPDRIGFFKFFTGPMFSGKTEILIKTMGRYKISGKNFLVFKPEKDNRYGDSVICTHNCNAVPAISISKFASILPYVANKPEGYYSAIFIDEIQFISGANKENIFGILEQGIDLYVSGLILDSYRDPFENVLPLLPYAKIYYNSSVCNFCGSFNAEYTHRVHKVVTDKIFLGGFGEYLSACGLCYNKYNNKKEA